MAAKHAGRRTRRMKELRANLKAQRRQPCVDCGQPIDYTLPHDHPMAFSVEHVKPLSRHPELAEDPGNLMPAHLNCNKSKGDGEAPPGLGTPSQVW